MNERLMKKRKLESGEEGSTNKKKSNRMRFGRRQKKKAKPFFCNGFHLHESSNLATAFYLFFSQNEKQRQQRPTQKKKVVTSKSF